MDRSVSPIGAILSRVTAPRTTIAPALVGSFLCWLAFPPVGWSYLAWVGPVPWLLLVTEEKLPGRRPYQALWLAGFMFWLLAVHWIRLPHPMNYLAWVALAAYLGLYLPVFVALSRVGALRLQLPPWLVAPGVWTGLEWFRAHLLTGFLMASLAHTQADHLPVIQIADVTGEYGVTFLVVFVAASIAQSLRAMPSPWAVLRLVPGTAAIVAAMLYGNSRIADITGREFRLGPRIAIIQGNTLADWKSDIEKQQQIMDDYIRLSRKAARDTSAVDLVIWPETAFRETLITVEPSYTPPAERVPQENLTAAQQYLKLLTKELGTAVLVGIDRVHVYPDAQGELAYDSYNSAVLVDKQGEVLGTYDKMHRVLFGEYIPFAQWFPVLYKLTPLTGGIDAGAAPAMLQADATLICPNICYETVVPHLIRAQVNGFDSERPDVLVNLTNDAWFWGSSELDMHLACGVFRAVENRLPLIVAANGGLSAEVDALGEVVEVSPRQEESTLMVEPQTRSVLSVYSAFGDWFALLCVLWCIVLAGWGWFTRHAWIGETCDGTAR